jgi:hypothetical protein
MIRDFGRHLYGVVAVVYGALTLYWHNDHTWPPLAALGNAPYRGAVTYLVAAAAIVGGLAILGRRTARAGAMVLGALFLGFAIFYLPGIVRAPLVYDSWGNFFEQFSIFSGALVAYAGVFAGTAPWRARVGAIGRACFGVSVLSFALEQAFYLHATATLVPKWIPPDQTFWAIATTIAFVLAALAILSGLWALEASRLLTAMLVLFGVLVWCPALVANRGSHFIGAETAETFAIAAAAWILADYLFATTPHGSAASYRESRRA